MKKIFTVVVAGFALIVLASGSHAQTSSTTTTTTWSDHQGAQLSQSYTSNKYTVVTDPNMQANRGVILPPTVALYPLPATITMPDRENYRSTIINSHPVVVEKTTRKVVHTWDK